MYGKLLTSVKIIHKGKQIRSRYASEGFFLKNEIGRRIKFDCGLALPVGFEFGW